MSGHRPWAGVRDAQRFRAATGVDRHLGQWCGCPLLECCHNEDTDQGDRWRVSRADGACGTGAHAHSGSPASGYVHPWEPGGRVLAGGQRARSRPFPSRIVLTPRVLPWPAIHGGTWPCGAGPMEWSPGGWRVEAPAPHRSCGLAWPAQAAGTVPRVPPRDPRECPALERALPADTAADGTWREDGSPCEALFGDGSWRVVTVIARWADRHGREVVQVEWHAAGTSWSDAHLFDPGKTREA